MPETTEQVGRLQEARDCVEQIGGVNDNSSAELAPIACACALIAIAEELRGIREELKVGHLG